jgi:DNA-binding winged helix-turn-helix (wHTH) protein
MPAAKKASFLDFELDFGRYRLCRGGHPMEIERLPLRLLMFLVENPGQPMTREQIREKLWGKDAIADDQGISTAVRKIRIALGDSTSDPKCVQTIQGGYVFIAEVTAGVAPKPSDPEPAFPGQVETSNREGLRNKDVAKRKLLRWMTLCIGGGLVGLIALATLNADLRLEAKSTVNTDIGNPYAVLITIRNESWFEVFDVQPSCETGYATADYKEVVVRGATTERISSIPAHGAALFVCNLAAAATGFAAEPYKVNKREFAAEIKLSYRSLFWFRKAKDYGFWVKPMNNGDVEWLQTH